MILRYVLDDGPLTVSEMARRHKVSRQYMAGVVDGFLRHGYVSLTDNPRHRRSKLVELTDQGREVLRRADERGGRACKRLERHFDVDQLESITETLKQIREFLEDRAGVRKRDADSR
jgi:DNA-binding MarR family transcriptional regulator